jgi:prophage regulatory protein
MKQLLEKVPVSRSTLYQWVKDGKFPKPVRKSSSRCTFWNESDVNDWMENAVKD